MKRILGYIRVSSIDQNIDRQLEGLKLDKIFTDHASGKDANRPALQALKEFVWAGDEVVVHSMDRLARNLHDLELIVKQFTDNGVTVRFLKENLIFTGEDDDMSKLMLRIMGAVAEFERSMIRTRQAEGIAAAKKRGVYRGRKPVVTKNMLDQIKERIASGESKAQIARNLNISRETLYKYIREESRSTD